MWGRAGGDGTQPSPALGERKTGHESDPTLGIKGRRRGGVLLLPLQPLIIHYPITPITCGIRGCCRFCGTPTCRQVVAEQRRSSTHAHCILHPSLHLRTASPPPTHPTSHPGNQPLTPQRCPAEFTHINQRITRLKGGEHHSAGRASWSWRDPV